MSSMPSRFQRVKQWLMFNRQWHIIDANHQDAFDIAKKVAFHLSGKHKPIFHPETDCGDNVVVINTRHVAMHAFDWNQISFHFDRRYPRSKNDLVAHKIHEYDPCRVFWLITSGALKEHVYRSNLPRRACLERLHLFPDATIPDFLQKNIGNQLEQVQTVHKKSTDYTEEERANFPRMFKLNENHILDWQEPLETPEWEPYVIPEKDKKPRAVKKDKE